MVTGTSSRYYKRMHVCWLLKVTPIIRLGDNEIPNAYISTNILAKIYINKCCT